MTKQLLLSFLLSFTLLDNYAQKQNDADDKYLFCKYYLSARTLLELSLRYNSNPDKMAMYLRDANLQASNAKGVLTTLTPRLKPLLTEDNIQHLNKVLDYIIKQSEQLHFEDTEVIRITVWLKLIPQIELHDNILSKLMRTVNSK